MLAIALSYIFRSQSISYNHRILPRQYSLGPTYKIEFCCVIVVWTGQGFRDVKNKWHDQITVAIVLVEMWIACVY